MRFGGLLGGRIRMTAKAESNPMNPMWLNSVLNSDNLSSAIVHPIGFRRHPMTIVVPRIHLCMPQSCGSITNYTFLGKGQWLLYC